MADDKPDFIDGDALEEALLAHADRMQMHGPKPIHRIIASLQVDSEEFQAMAQSVLEARGTRPHERGPYSGGFVDGFVIGVRAARAAARRRDA